MLLPATLIASMWGTNVGGVPFSDDPHGFVWVSGLVVASIVLAFVGLRRLRER